MRIKSILAALALAASAASVPAAEVTNETAVLEEIVQGVYGEGTNSSFIVRKELTATQKRFLALGFRYLQLANACNALDARLKVFEAEKAERDAAREKAAKKRREKSERDRDAVKRAIERTQTGKSIKRQHPAARRAK